MGDVWALVADVHGNLAALRRALEHAGAEGAVRVAFLGDALGGPEDEACCRLLMETAELAVFGNREVRVRYAVSDPVRAWLRALPATARLGPLLLCHSSPASAFPPSVTAGAAAAFRRGRSYWALYPYISGRASVSAAATGAGEQGAVGVAHGHTHRQALWRAPEGGEPERVREPEVAIGTGSAIVAGVGSVGEGPRGRVEYALYREGDAVLRLVSLDAA